MKKDKTLRTIQEAKDYSITKWNPIIPNIERILNDGGKSCGFCLHQDQESKGCHGCIVSDKCNELDSKFFAPIQASLDYLVNDLIPFIENFEEPKEKTQ